MGRFITAASAECRCRIYLGISLLGVAIAGPAGAGGACYRVVNVDLWDVLYIRGARSHLSKPVGAIAADHSGLIRATGPCQPRNANPRRQWCPVDYFPLPSVRLSGFVKAHFIERQACPPN